MKVLAFRSCLLMFMFAILTSASHAQVRSVAAANKQPPPQVAPGSPANKQTVNRPNATRLRVSAQDAKAESNGTPPGGPALQAHAKSASNRSPNTFSVPPGINASGKAPLSVTANRARTVTDNSAKPSGAGSTSSALNANASSKTLIPAAPSQVYRIGVRDVLDIQLPGQSSKQSTLFTIIDGGLLEYPLAGGPIAAGGMTTAELSALLRQRVKILDNPNVVVKVRDYASHPVTIIGFVAAPGVKNLRREAVPLYTLLAEALMLPEAARATISRQGRAPVVVDLKDSTLASTLVLPGDAIKVSGTPPAPSEFFFVGGEINAPGQKPYHAGVTLTQALLASGGATKNAGSRVRVSRQGTDGRLLTEEYNLRKIQEGKNPDPVLQKGDRIEVSENR